MAQHFDENKLEVAGDPVQVAEQVTYYSTYWALFSASANGILVYRGGTVTPLSQTTWFDRQGKPVGAMGDPASFFGLALSPNNKMAVVGLLNDVHSFSVPDLWLFDFSRDAAPIRFTLGQGFNSTPVFSPDGSRIAFASNRDGGIYKIYQKPTSSATKEEVLLNSSVYAFPTSWSSDGRFLLYIAWDPKTYKGDLALLPLEGNRKPISFLSTEFNELDGRFSPDMKWVAYMSDESGSNEIYVRPFSKDYGGTSTIKGQWLVSKGGGMGPRWRGDGKELYYRAFDGNIMAVEVTPGATFQAGPSKPLFKAPPDLSEQATLYSFPTWDVTSDGSRFLLPKPVAETSPSPFTVIVNWNSLFKK